MSSESEVGAKGEVPGSNPGLGSEYTRCDEKILVLIT